MSDEKDINQLNKSLASLHEKQDIQTESLNEMKSDLVTQKILLGVYTKQQDKIADQITAVDKKLDEKLSEYNYQLKIHIQGVQELKTQNQLIRTEIEQRDKEWSTRLEVAEKPIKWLETTGNMLKWIGGISAALASLYGFLKLLKIF